MTKDEVKLVTQVNLFWMKVVNLLTQHTGDPNSSVNVIMRKIIDDLELISGLALSESKAHGGEYTLPNKEIVGMHKEVEYLFNKTASALGICVPEVSAAVQKELN